MNKEELIIDLIAHPERYSDAQMQDILSDDEALAAYTALLEARMAIDKQSAETIDIDAAWRDFAAQNAELLERHRAADADADESREPTATPKTATLHYFLAKWRKIAAMFVAAVAVSGIAFAAIHTFTADRTTQKATVEAARTAEENAAAVADTARAASASKSAPEPKPVIRKTFENVSLGAMLQEIAAYYGMTVEFRNQDARSLRYYYEWDSANGANAVIDELNHSEQVAITIEGKKIIVE